MSASEREREDDGDDDEQPPRSRRSRPARRCGRARDRLAAGRRPATGAIEGSGRTTVSSTAVTPRRPPGGGAAASSRDQRVGGLHEPALVLDAARAVAQVDVEPRGSALVELAVEPVRHEPLGARRTSRCPDSGRSERRSALRPVASALASSSS